MEECRIHSKPNYYKIQEYTVHKHISEYFKNCNFQKVKPNDIRDYQQTLILSGLNHKSINNIMIILSGIFEKAVEEQVILSNPCSTIKNLSIDKKKMKFWTPDQFKDFISFIDEKEFLFKTFYTFAYLTGMRCGEMLALTWVDIDKYKSEVDVYKSLTYLNKEIIITRPKTKKRHKTYQHQQKKLIKLLDEWKEKQKDLFF
ncbi:tyrosine-type recombinase/integrase [Geomicrobium sp. JCM 19055]|uniref:tyrosine-type recombinase/integrase n=1 Tax=Geomicrobium sp. JCM 19055 TaxID=1460649 RepID=UPI00045EDC7B|nr:tyrosine-type recombinase/integrase [Geomicrobium sp. JCM 19055]GAJ99562.1 integrase [Geomicrobium sp. JCM 19055]